jgi:hypothetical protein
VTTVVFAAPPDRVERIPTIAGVRGGAETRPDAIDPRRGDIIRPIG